MRLLRANMPDVADLKQLVEYFDTMDVSEKTNRNLSDGPTLGWWSDCGTFDYETLGTLLLKLEWDESDTSGVGCCTVLYRLRVLFACSRLRT